MGIKRNIISHYIANISFITYFVVIVLGFFAEHCDKLTAYGPFYNLPAQSILFWYGNFAKILIIIETILTILILIIIFKLLKKSYITDSAFLLHNKYYNFIWNTGIAIFIYACISVISLFVIT